MTFTYPETGRTRGGDLPAGYRHVRRHAVVGRGEQAFARVREGMRDWRIHKLAGLRIRGAGQPGIGVAFDAALGFFWVPCEVLWLRDENTDYGYGLGTLAGHPLSGEEAFEVRLSPDGDVRFAVRAFSRRVSWYARLGGPLIAALQDVVTDRFVRSARILAQKPH
ncbi:MAG TPA: DUF1990 domain-containing protein [Candidatus Limnocylindrales bacterium]|nr:DUF1990 domain-containing protein [Candidatus Limnocylindrales bacterium]